MDDSQEASPVRLTWLGHATVLVEADGTRVLTDPLLRRRLMHLRRRVPSVPLRPAEVDVIVISHPHLDHLDLPSLRSLPADTPLVVPTGVGKVVRRTGMRNVEELRLGHTLSVGQTLIRAVWAEHSGFRPPFGPRAEAIGYVIGQNERVYFAGDTGPCPQFSELRGEVDVALLPVGGWGPTLRGGHLDPLGAAHAVLEIGARVALPIHWGTYWPIGLPLSARFMQPGWRFARFAAELAPAIDVRPWTVGDVVTLRPSGSLEAFAVELSDGRDVRSGAWGRPA